ncbi:MAG: hypothetical protein CMN94_01805, partial [Synechococcus sp. EAC657]|nr:hypothetical protein [Synechococcus sp. EAC657]
MLITFKHANVLQFILSIVFKRSVSTPDSMILVVGRKKLNLSVSGFRLTTDYRFKLFRPLPFLL